MKKDVKKPLLVTKIRNIIYNSLKNGETKEDMDQTLSDVLGLRVCVNCGRVVSNNKCCLCQ